MPWVEDEQVRGTIMKAGFGRGFNFWAAAISLQARRLGDLLTAYSDVERAEFTVEGQRRRADWSLQALADAHYLAVGVRHVLRHAREFRGLIGKVDSRPAAALDSFMSGRGKQSQTIRDVLEHWDEYSIGGKPYPRQMKRSPEEFAGQLQVTARDGDLYIGIGGVEVPALEVAQDAIRLAEELGRSWWEAISPPGAC